MKGDTLFNYQQSLFERACSMESLTGAFKQVKKNKGAPGIDGMTIEDFENKLVQELRQLKQEVESWTYKPRPVRYVEIPKPGQSGVRILGIPCVRDRVCQASLKAVLEPILDSTFSESSYGFRPGRNQRQAVEAVQKIAQSGKEHVVDIDLSKFFDRIHHDRLITRLKQFIPDKRILRLIGITLRSGIMKDGLVKATTEGSVQGSPLSPLLSNVVLDELDKELESRGLQFSRFADDCNILVRTPKAAERVMTSVSKFIEKKLKLRVNWEKSKVALSKNVKFLGMTIIAGTLAISTVSMKRVMEKAKQLTPRGHHLTLEKTVEKINSYYLGWAGYYKMTQYPSQLKAVEAHIRRRLRARIVSNHKRRRFLYRKLVKRGVSKKYAAKTVYSNNGIWALSHNFAMSKAYPNDWFINELGLEIVSQDKHQHWFDVKKWIKLT